MITLTSGVFSLAAKVCAQNEDRPALAMVAIDTKRKIAGACDGFMFGTVDIEVDEGAPEFTAAFRGAELRMINRLRARGATVRLEPVGDPTEDGCFWTVEIVRTVGNHPVSMKIASFQNSINETILGSTIGEEYGIRRETVRDRASQTHEVDGYYSDGDGDLYFEVVLDAYLLGDLLEAAKKAEVESRNPLPIRLRATKKYGRPVVWIAPSMRGVLMPMTLGAFNEDKYRIIEQEKTKDAEPEMADTTEGAGDGDRERAEDRMGGSGRTVGDAEGDGDTPSGNPGGAAPENEGSAES